MDKANQSTLHQNFAIINCLFVSQYDFSAFGLGLLQNVLKQDPESLLKQGKHPPPEVEIDFWKTKAGNLNAIFDQLQSERVRKVLQFLDQARSTYCTPFAKLCREVFAAREEANDNVKYLRTLEGWFQKLSGSSDFEELHKLFKPIMHILLLIWKNSRYYNTPARLVVVIREICNAIVSQAFGFVNGKLIFEYIDEEEPQAAVKRLKTTLKICSAFKSVYAEYKSTANAECPSNPWKIQNSALFLRLDAFIERCYDVLEMTDIIVKFNKLQRIEIGGTKGKTLTHTVQQIYEDFQQAVSDFRKVPYDIMDVEQKAFDTDFYKFRQSVKELERRLGSVLTRGFDDQATISARFKLLESFDTLLERPIIQDELERKHISLVQAYGEDLKRVQEIFLTERDNPPIGWNLPPIAGALTWCRGLKERIMEPMRKLRDLNKSVMEREESKEVINLYTTLMNSLGDYEHARIEEWGADLEKNSEAKLKLNLLVRGAGGPHVTSTGDPDVDASLLQVNFDAALVRLLREVKYFLLMGLEVPATALTIYQKSTTYRKYTTSLEMMTNMYNQMMIELLPVEAPLMRPQLTKIDNSLKAGLEQLNWMSGQLIDNFINDTSTLVKSAHATLFHLKQNLDEVSDILEKWCETPLLERKPKPMTPDEFDNMYKTLKSSKFTAIKQGGVDIEKKLKDSHATMGVNKSHPNWLAYTDFVNGVVVQGLSKMVCTSLQYLAEQLDAEYIQKHGKQPMLIVELTLQDDGVKYVPSIEDEDDDEEGSVDEGEEEDDDEEAGGKSKSSIYAIVGEWVDSFYQAVGQLKRLDDPEGRYMKEVQGDLNVQMLLARIYGFLEDTEASCKEHQSYFEKYSWLWENDVDEEFANFKNEAFLEVDPRERIEENEEEEEETGSHDEKENEVEVEFLRTPDLDKFDEEIKKFETIQEEISNMSSATNISWLRVNNDPAKIAIGRVANKWTKKYTGYLERFITDELEDLINFMDTVNEGIQKEVSEQDESKENLRAVMAIIRDVKACQDRRKALFSPLKKTVELLKQHGVHVDDLKVSAGKAVEFLESAPLKWKDTVTRTFSKREEIFPLQTAESEVIKNQAEEVFVAMRSFRNDFRKNAPFAFSGPADDAYALLDKYWSQLQEMEQKAADLNEQESLFELPISKFQEIADTRNEIKLLKQLWDLKSLVLSTYDDWKQTLWSDIDTDELEDQNKKLRDFVKKFGDSQQIVKGWSVFRDIETEVKDMAVGLPLVNQLHSPAMRERHWNRLAEVCNVKDLDPSDPNFSLQSLLDLELHRHELDVTDVVDTAERDLKIEQKLNVIGDAWKEFELEFVPHKDTETYVIKVSDEVMEALETHQMELQSLQGSEHFQHDVDDWQAKLGLVEEVLREWMSVTKQWANLEVVFLTSEDIKESLPEDTKRFDQINKDFEELMKSAVETPNVVEACTKEGRKDNLKQMNEMLDLCQKSLNEYLDMKKKKFPRFYFVSNVDLLDILSNGNNPPRITKHLSSCYDALSDLAFKEPEEEGQVKNTATSMTASDGEVVEFSTPFVAQGPVEDWLNDLTKKMQDSLRDEAEKAVETAVNWEVETPRHIWLEHYPAQISLVGTQIFWTEETHRALEEYEAGTEDAVKKYYQICNERLNALIGRVIGYLSKDLRIKIIALITLDVHSRDVVQRLIDEKAEGPGSFLWAQQLRFSWEPYNKDINIAITDFRTKYCYEWVGNAPRLVITPLTDRCYITLTMALRLMLGGAPAGPAGTGKTETTKDLARSLALPCYVFNCSDQMTYQTIANIFKGLAQCGAWGCFDEFNRISIEVLSVVATQVYSVLTAVKQFSNPMNREEQYQHLPAGTPPTVVGQFELQGDTVKLIPTVGLFITMNPGYAGRTELPENLKVLFRSCAMIRPDLALICENMLMSEGFQNARPLSVKFVTLYQLASELLAPHPHYDWGLRAVKSVLIVAGALKRAEPETVEDAILMRALRDFNTPKMTNADIPIFLRLIQDLFPQHHNLPPKFDTNVEQGAIEACKEFDPPLQYDRVFINKVVQFQELLDVRHSVMILGPGGCGKTSVWKTLAGHHNRGGASGERPPPNRLPLRYDVVNPKALTSDELYGYMTLGNDWKDGVVSIIMRGMSKNDRELGYHDYQIWKWVVLDDDIDAEWIESMNTVMDDNKVLTLVSNERIPLTDAMRMVFEINSLKNATPATVSRAGILYINDTDVGWRPFVESWIARRKSDSERAHLPSMFDKYIEDMFERLRKGYKQAVPLVPINQVMSVCHLLDGMLPSLPESPNTEQVEHVFVMALVWAFGGPLIVEKGEGKDYRRSFHEVLSDLAGNVVKFPKEIPGNDKPTCFDFYYQPAESNAKGSVGELLPWADKVEKYVPVPIGTGPSETPFSKLNVPTVDTVRMSGIMDLLVKKGHHVMFVGNAGTGKTSLVKNYLNALDSDHMLSYSITMNYYTDSRAFQVQVDDAVDKRSGRIYGPPAGKKMVFFVDDLNLPYIEKYGTQNSLSLFRQMIDHKSYYDREDVGFRKDLVDCQYVAAMNPTSGSFTITERLQRYFTTIACLMPNESDLELIYGAILQGHLEKFSEEVQTLGPRITEASIKLHETVSKKFLPSAITFVYNWNMRELSNIYQGLTLARAEFYPKPITYMRLWIHECYRVFSDRMVSEEDQGKFHDLLKDMTDKRFKEFSVDELYDEPLIFTNFAAQPSGGSDPCYLPLPPGEKGMEILSNTLQQKLAEHNEGKMVMNLVLFEQAMEHVCRISRIISNPRGHAMLVGVGGSGKQSLSRLAAYICGYETVQLAITSKFSVMDFKESLQGMFKTAGQKGQGVVFLMTDSQIVNDEFLVYVNDILSSGWITDLFEREDLEAMFASLKNEAKAVGISPDQQDQMMDFLIERVQQNLHLVLCFSPVGETFRIRARRFPGLINCTANDRFHAWPREALVSVASNNIEDIEDVFPSPEVKTQVAEHMASAHVSVTSVAEQFKEKYGRHVYSTPKSFLELIGFYKHLLNLKMKESQANVSRLDEGLSKLRQTQQDVAELQTDLSHTMEKVKEKVAATEKLLEEIKEQRAEAEEQEASASKVAEKAAEAKAEAEKLQANADKELAEAMPMMERAQAALDSIDKSALTQLKSYSNPPKAVLKVTNCCLMMLENEFKNLKWDKAKRMMNNVTEFVQRCKDFANNDAKTMPDQLVNALQPYIDDEDFTVENMSKVSEAAGSLTLFVRAVYNFNRVWVTVKPLMDGLEESTRKKEAAIQDKEKADAEVAEVRAKVQALEDKLADAEAEKKEVEDEAEKCQNRLQLAERLVNGLSSENKRWGEEVERLKTNELRLIGNVLLAAAFVSYAGGFDHEFREKLWSETWTPDLREREIPLSDDADPLSVLVTEAKVAAMQNEGLPADRISTENGAIIVSSQRWPLMIDPQLQGIKWLRRRFHVGEEGSDCIVIQLTQNQWQRKLSMALSNGNTVLIENLSEEIDATLDPVLSRAVVQRGRNFYVNFSGEDVEYSSNFKMFLQTKLSNPHFKPELQAQCSLINFIATEKGLQDQLLARVVNEEKSELEEKKQKLQEAFNTYKMQLIELEDDLLNRLANAPDDILSDVALIEGLEATKKASVEIENAVEKGKETEKEINTAREVYVPVAEEGAMLYFMITNLNAIDHMYQYSLDSYVLYFYKAIREAPKSDETNKRVSNLRDTLRLTIFTWVQRGLFEKHKLILTAQLTFQLMQRKKLHIDFEFNHIMFQFLLLGGKKADEPKPASLEWLPDAAWHSLQALASLEDAGFERLPSDLDEAPARFNEWFNHVSPESEKLPLDWASLEKEPFKKLLVLKCLRPDRLNTALQNFISQILPFGNQFVEVDSGLNSLQILENTLADSKPTTPLYFILSPGADVVGDLDQIASKRGFEKGVNYHNISMGQGQDKKAIEALELGHRQGHWVILNNVHLMPRWLVELEKKLDQFAEEGSHERFRVFLTSEAAPSIPIGILNRSIKLTNEPPTGLKANLKRAFNMFSPEYINEIDSKMRAILFGLCHFHAVMIERKKFGPMGFNMSYPFSLGDLRDSAVCLSNYMENSPPKIPWEDLRYIFGQIMYGGHIVNDFDRLICVTYLEHFMRDELLDEMEMFPFNKDEDASFISPSPTTYDRYIEHIDEKLKGDTPVAFGLHPNAEIGFRTAQSEYLFRTLQDLQPREAAGEGEEAKSPQQIAEQVMQDILDMFGDVSFDLEDVAASVEGERGPFQNVLLLELEQMNILLGEMRRSLEELGQGFEGLLTMTDSMEELKDSLFLNRVPPSWGKLAWPSLRGLSGWRNDLSSRLAQLNEWKDNPSTIPTVTWISGLINPSAFLTAIRQQTAQANKQELDKLEIQTEVTKKGKEEIEGPSRDGAYISGLHMQGARWDFNGGFVDRSKPREMFCPMPVINCKAVPTEKLETKNIYNCPVYKTESRGPTFVFMAQLKTKSPASRWILAGVALIMDVIG